MLLKAAKIEHQGLRDPSVGLLERPGLHFQVFQSMKILKNRVCMIQVLGSWNALGWILGLVFKLQEYFSRLLRLNN